MSCTLQPKKNVKEVEPTYGTSWGIAWVYGASRDTWWPSMVNYRTGLGGNYMGDKNGK